MGFVGGCFGGFSGGFSRVCHIRLGLLDIVGMPWGRGLFQQFLVLQVRLRWLGPELARLQPLSLLPVQLADGLDADVCTQPPGRSCSSPSFFLGLCPAGHKACWRVLVVACSAAVWLLTHSTLLAHAQQCLLTFAPLVSARTAR